MYSSVGSYFFISCFLSYAYGQPDSWGIPSTSYNWMTDNFFWDRSNIAKALNKPIILEEYGMRAQGELNSAERELNILHSIFC